MSKGRLNRGYDTGYDTEDDVVVEVAVLVVAVTAAAVVELEVEAVVIRYTETFFSTHLAIASLKLLQVSDWISPPAKSIPGRTTYAEGVAM